MIAKATQTQPKVCRLFIKHKQLQLQIVSFFLLLNNDNDDDDDDGDDAEERNHNYALLDEVPCCDNR